MKWTRREQAWRYRDYVVRSLNEDKPYDRFILEQLAGDELTPPMQRRFRDARRPGFLRAVRARRRRQSG